MNTSSDKSTTIIIIGILVLITLVGGGIGVWYFFIREDDKKANPQQAAVQAAAPAAQLTPVQLSNPQVQLSFAPPAQVVKTCDILTSFVKSALELAADLKAPNAAFIAASSKFSAMYSQLTNFVTSAEALVAGSTTVAPAFDARWIAADVRKHIVEEFPKYMAEAVAKKAVLVNKIRNEMNANKQDCDELEVYLTRLANSSAKPNRAPVFAMLNEFSERSFYFENANGFAKMLKELDAQLQDFERENFSAAATTANSLAMSSTVQFDRAKLSSDSTVVGESYLDFFRLMLQALRLCKESFSEKLTTMFEGLNEKLVIMEDFSKQYATSAAATN